MLRHECPSIHFEARLRAVCAPTPALLAAHTPLNHPHGQARRAVQPARHAGLHAHTKGGRQPRLQRRAPGQGVREVAGALRCAPHGQARRHWRLMMALLHHQGYNSIRLERESGKWQVRCAARPMGRHVDTGSPRWHRSSMEPVPTPRSAAGVPDGWRGPAAPDHRHPGRV